MWHKRRDDKQGNILGAAALFCCANEPAGRFVRLLPPTTQQFIAPSHFHFHSFCGILCGALYAIVDGKIFIKRCVWGHIYVQIDREDEGKYGEGDD